MNRIHTIATECFAIVSGASSIAAWQDQVDWVLRILAALVAIAAGLASLYFGFRRRRDDRRRTRFD